MSDLISRSQEVKNETTAGANTATRIGGILEDQARATRTVDTIADLRALDDMVDGDTVFVRSHNSSGLNRGYGAGLFKWKTAQLFAINSGATGNGTRATYPPPIFGITSLQESLYADLDYGQNLVFEGGATLEVQVHTFTDTTTDQFRSWPKGSTSIRGVLNGTVVPAEKAYYADDNGVWVRPSYVGFDGVGYWERVLVQNKVTPMDYGAIPESTKYNPTPFDSSQALQDVFDCPFDVDFNGGNFYTSVALTVQRNKSILSPEGFQNSRRERRQPAYEYLKGGVVYTDQNLPSVITSDCGGHFRLKIDTSQVTNHVGNAWRHDCSARVWGGTYEISVLGNETSLTAAAGTGTVAFLLDTKNAVKTESAVSVKYNFAGAFHESHVKVYAEDCLTGIWKNANPDDPEKPMSVNGVNFTLFGGGNKRGYFIENSIDNSTYTGETHSGATPRLFESEKDWALNTIRGSNTYVDFYCWDMYPGQTDGTLHTHDYAIEFKSARITIGPRTRGQMNQNPGVFKNREILQQNIPHGIDNDMVNFPAYRGGEAAHISRLSNKLAFFNKRDTLTAASYVGAGYNFSTNLDESTALAEALNVTVSDFDHCVDITQFPNTKITFSSGASLADDFVEYVFDGGSDQNSLRITDLTVTLRDNGTLPLKIQAIVLDDGVVDSTATVTIDSTISGTKSFLFRNFAGSFGSNKLILRFIGSQALGNYDILDVFARPAGEDHDYYPYIHTGGGQRIYGNLTVESLSYSGYTSGARLYRRGTKSFRVERDLTSAQILALNSSPITLTNEVDMEALAGTFGNPAPIPIRAYVRSVGGTTDYATNTNMVIRDSTNGSQLEMSILSLNGGAVYSFKQAATFGTHSRFSGGLNLFVEGGNPTGGDKTFTIVVDFEIVI